MLCPSLTLTSRIASCNRCCSAGLSLPGDWRAPNLACLNIFSAASGPNPSKGIGQKLLDGAGICFVQQLVQLFQADLPSLCGTTVCQSDFNLKGIASIHGRRSSCRRIKLTWHHVAQTF